MRARCARDAPPHRRRDARRARVDAKRAIKILARRRARRGRRAARARGAATSIRAPRATVAIRERPRRRVARRDATRRRHASTRERRGRRIKNGRDAPFARERRDARDARRAREDSIESARATRRGSLRGLNRILATGSTRRARGDAVRGAVGGADAGVERAGRDADRRARDVARADDDGER